MSSPGDFSHVKDPHTREILDITYQAVTNTDSWGFMKTVVAAKEGSCFMFKPHPRISNIIWECEKLGCGHSSGRLWDFAMRNMEAIAKKGWENYVSNK